MKTVARKIERALKRMKLPLKDAHGLPSSPKRFPDGAQYRVEIPSTEGPRALRAVFDTADELGVTIHRISQGSGMMLLTDAEIREMSRMALERGIEVSLFVGPRAGFEPSAMAQVPAGKVLGWRHRGMDQVRFAIDDIKRGCDLGVRGILVADIGLLRIVQELKRDGVLPKDLVVKISVQMGECNPASIKLLEELGAGTVNVPSDLSLPQLAAIRQAIKVPIDLYIESPDGLGGFIRFAEIPEIVRVASPVYVKFGLRNAPDIYPSGTHLEDVAVRLSRERVRRAKLALEPVHPALARAQRARLQHLARRRHTLRKLAAAVQLHIQRFHQPHSVFQILYQFPSARRARR